MTFQLHPVPPAAAALARSTGVDASGNPVVYLTADGGEPLRCCLRDAEPGEKAMLFGYRPVLPKASPYAELGAVYTHAEACAGPETTTEYPKQWVGRAQVLRAYDENGWIHDASTRHDGTDPAAAIEAVLSEPGVVEVHSRNIVWGCYMFSITR